MKSGESSYSRAAQLTKYHSYHNRSVDGETISVDFGYDTLARVLTGAGIQFKMTVTPIALCPEPMAVGETAEDIRKWIAYVAPSRILKECVIMLLTRGVWLDTDHQTVMRIQPGMVLSANQHYGRGSSDSAWAARAVGSTNDHTATCNSPSRKTKRVRAVSATTVEKHGVEGATLGGVSKRVRAVCATTVEKHGVEGATLGGVSKKFRKYAKQPEARPTEGREVFTVMCVKEVDGALCGNLRQTSATNQVRCRSDVARVASRAGAPKLGHGYVSCLPALQQPITHG